MVRRLYKFATRSHSPPLCVLLKPFVEFGAKEVTNGPWALEFHSPEAIHHYHVPF